MCEQVEENHESGGVRGKLKTLGERKTVNLHCLMLNACSGLYFMFCHMSSEMPLSFLIFTQFLFRTRPA